MSAHPQPQLDAIALQLIAAVESYEREFERLLASWPDMEQYRAVSEGIDAVRLYAAALPSLSVQFVALLIAHAELVHALWQQTQGKAVVDRDELQPTWEQHQQCAASLRVRCKSLLR